MELSDQVMRQFIAAAQRLGVSQDALLRQLLGRYCGATVTLLPVDFLLDVFSYVDVWTLSYAVTRVCRRWHDVLREVENLQPPAEPLALPARPLGTQRLRRAHGIYILDAARGLLFYPMGLRRYAASAPAEAHPRGEAAPTERHGMPDTHRLTMITQYANSSRGTNIFAVELRVQEASTLPWAARRLKRLAKHSSRHNQPQPHADPVAAIDRGRATPTPPHLTLQNCPVLSRAAVVTHNRRIYVFGGCDARGHPLRAAYMFDACLRTWTPLPPLRRARFAAVGVVCGSRIFVVGGYARKRGDESGLGFLVRRAHRYHRQQSAPTPTAAADTTTTTSRRRFGGGGDNDGFLCCSGEDSDEDEDGDGADRAYPHAEDTEEEEEGEDGDDAGPETTDEPHRIGVVVSKSYEVFDTDTMQWAMPTQMLPFPLCGAAAVAHKGGILLLGGKVSGSVPSHLNAIVSSPAHSASDGDGDRSGGASPSVGGWWRVSQFGKAPVLHWKPQIECPRDGVVDDGGNSMLVLGLCPRTAMWTVESVLGSGRSFGSAIVLDLPHHGPCLCYFGGVSGRADQPMLAALWRPLTSAGAATTLSAHGRHRQSLAGPRPPPPTEEEETVIRVTPATDDRGAGSCPWHLDRATVAVAAPRWEVAESIPTGGKHCSVAVVGTAARQLLVVCGTHPQPAVSVCLVRHLLPIDFISSFFSTELQHEVKWNDHRVAPLATTATTTTTTGSAGADPGAVETSQGTSSAHLFRWDCPRPAGGSPLPPPQHRSSPAHHSATSPHGSVPSGALGMSPHMLPAPWDTSNITSPPPRAIPPVEPIDHITLVAQRMVNNAAVIAVRWLVSALPQVSSLQAASSAEAALKGVKAVVAIE